MYHFNGRTARPLGPCPAPGCDEPTSRCRETSATLLLGTHSAKVIYFAERRPVHVGEVVLAVGSLPEQEQTILNAPRTSAPHRINDSRSGDAFNRILLLLPFPMSHRAACANLFQMPGSLHNPLRLHELVSEFMRHCFIRHISLADIESIPQMHIVP